MKFYFPLFFAIILFFSHHSQSLAQLEYRGITPKINAGVHRGGFYTDINLLFGYRNVDKSSNSFVPVNIPERGFMWSMGVESNYFFKTDFRLTPKITFEYHDYLNLLIFRLQNRLYPAQDMNFAKASFQTCPEVGINIFGLVFLTYGYSFGLTNRDVTKDLGHQVNIGFALPFGD